MRREKRTGSIVSISSVASRGGPHFLAAYNLSKSALNNLTKTSAYALMRDRIKINALCPGWMDTPAENKIHLLSKSTNSDGETMINIKFGGKILGYINEIDL